MANPRDNSANLASYVMDRWKEGCRARSDRKTQWEKNECFLNGKQWIKWDDKQNRVYEPVRQPWKVQLVVNMTLAKTRQELGRLTTQPHLMDAWPLSWDAEAVQAARIADTLVGYWQTSPEINLKGKDLQVKSMSLAHGVSFLGVFWDPTAMDATGEKVGEVSFVPLCGYEVVPYPSTAKNLSEADGVVVGRQVSKRALMATYADADPSVFENIKAEPLSLGGDDTPALAYKTAGAINSGGGTGAGEGYTVYTLYENPSDEHPDGRYITTCQKQVLRSGPIPYKPARIPIVEFPYSTFPTNSIWKKSFVEDQIPLQVEYNKSRSARIEARNAWIGMMKVLLPSDSGLGPLDFTDKPGELLVYHGNARGDKPYPLQFTPNDSMFTKDEQDTLRDLDNITFQHEITRGQTPPNVESGVAIQALMESDNVPVGPTYGLFEQGWAQAMQMALERAEQFYGERRTLYTVGRDRALDLVTMSKDSKFAGKVKLLVRAGSSVPRSRAAYQWLILQLRREGVLQDPRQVQRLLEIRGGVDFEDSSAVDTNAARSENYKLSTGEDMSPMEYEDHTIHIMEHDHWRKHPAFRQAPDSIKAAFKRHVDGHKMALQPPVGGPMGEPGPSPEMAPNPASEGKPVPGQGRGPSPPSTTPRGAGGPEPRPGGAPIEAEMQRMRGGR